MPCQDDELFAQGPEQLTPVTPPRLLRNAGASHYQSNAEESAENASELEDKDCQDNAADEVSDKPRGTANSMSMRLSSGG